MCMQGASSKLGRFSRPICPPFLSPKLSEPGAYVRQTCDRHLRLRKMSLYDPSRHRAASTKHELLFILFWCGGSVVVDIGSKILIAIQKCVFRTKWTAQNWWHNSGGKYMLPGAGLVHSSSEFPKTTVIVFSGTLAPIRPPGPSYNSTATPL